MAEELKQFTIDLQGETVYTGLDARYGDTNVFKVTVLDNGDAADLTGATAMVSITRLDGDVKTVAGTIEGNVVTFKLMGDSLKIAGLARGSILFFYADSRTSTADFTFTASYDPTRQGFKPDELEKSLIETVLGEGPGVIADARQATQEATQATYTLTGAVGGAISSLNQDKAEALQQMDAKKAEVDEFLVVKGEEFDVAEFGRSQAFTDAQDQRAQDYAGFKSTVEEELETAIDTTKIERKGMLANDAALNALTGMQQGDSYTIKNSASNDNLSRTVYWNGTAWITTDLQDPTAINTLTAQLDDKADLTEVRKSTSALPINVNEMDTETKALFTGGAVAVVGVDSTGKENIKQDAVDEYKIDFINVLSNNIVDDTKLLLGGYFTGAGTWTVNATYKSTDFIPVVPGDTYTKNNALTASYWDVNYQYISSFTSATFTVPANAKYVRLTYLTSDAFPQLNKGNALLTYDSYKIGAHKFKATDIEPEEVIGFVQTTTENLLNKDAVTRGFKLDTSGNPTVDVTYAYSDFIPVNPWGIYYPTNLHTINYYDANQNWIQSGGMAQPFTVPINSSIRFARYNIPIAQLNTAMFVAGDSLPSTYIPFYKLMPDKTRFSLKDYMKSRLYGKKWNAYGDSITARGFGYHSIIKTAVGGMTVRNYGLSGRSLASRGASADASFPPGVFDYVNMDNDADIITMFLGTNDYNSQVPLGALNSTVATEFHGALNIVALGLIEKYPGKKIAFFTPMQRRVDNAAIPLTSYVKAVKDIGAKYGIPVLDLYANCGLYPKSDTINNTYFEAADGLHPNIKGHSIMSPRIQSFMETL